jgi:hypothetical protein
VFGNALIVKNRAAAGAAFFGANTTFINTTFADNVGAGIQADVGRTRLGVGVTLKNTLLSKNSAAHCSAGTANIQDNGNNLEFPTRSCTQASINADPWLDTLYIPVPGSAAMNNGDNNTCMTDPISARDVYGKRRPQGISCTIGAVEGDLEKEVADQTVGGPAWPGGLGAAGDGGAGGAGQTGSRPGRRPCCCCRR